MLDPAQQQRRTYWLGCRRRGHPWRSRGEHWNRWFLAQSLVLSSKKLLPQQQDPFTEAFLKCFHQSSDLFPRRERGEKWGMRWINGFKDIQAWSRGGERYRIIPAPSPVIGCNAQWLSVGEEFSTSTWFGDLARDKGRVRDLLTYIAYEWKADETKVVV